MKQIIRIDKQDGSEDIETQERFERVMRNHAGKNHSGKSCAPRMINDLLHKGIPCDTPVARYELREVAD